MNAFSNGNGFDTLPWSANENQRNMAYTGVDLSDHGRRYVQDQRYCRILANEEAIWRKIIGGPAEFPFPADSDFRDTYRAPVWSNLSGDCQSRGDLAQVVW